MNSSNDDELYYLAYPTYDDLQKDKLNCLKYAKDEYDFTNDINSKEEIFKVGFELGIHSALLRLSGNVQPIPVLKPVTTSDLTAEEQSQLSKLESNE